MRSSLTLAAVASVSLVVSATAMAEDAVVRLEVYGHIRADIIYDDSQANAAQTPMFVLPEAPGEKNRSNLTMHPRLSRFGVAFHGPELDQVASANVSGRLELDFQNGGRESRATPRYRHAFVNLSWNRFDVLIGQTSDVISPLFPTANGDTLMWNAGNLGDRRMQLRSTYQSQGRDLRWSVPLRSG